MEDSNGAFANAPYHFYDRGLLTRVGIRRTSTKIRAVEGVGTTWRPMGAAQLPPRIGQSAITLEP